MSSACGRCGRETVLRGDGEPLCFLHGGVGTLERFRPLAERLDFWAATEASACGGDDDAISAAHYVEFIFSPRSDTMRRYT